MKQFFLPLILFAAVVFFCTSARSRQPDPVKDERLVFWSVDDGSVRRWWLTNANTIVGGESCARIDSLGHESHGIAWCRMTGDGQDGSALHLVMRKTTSEKGFIGVLPVDGKEILMAENARDIGNVGTRRSGNCLGNMGGNKEQCYFQRFDNDGRSLLRWNGTGFDTLVRFPETEGFNCADIAVDSLGRAWFFLTEWTKVGIKNVNSPVEGAPSRLCCYTPEGKEVYSIPVKSFPMGNAYGLILMNGTFYIGFGEGNKRYHQKLLPLVYKEGKMYPGKPISFAAPGTTHDLASMNPGTPKFPGKAND